MKKQCIIVTCFDENQPGFLDFSYRILALTKDYKLTIVSQRVITQPELLVTEASYRVFTIPTGKIGWLKYLMQSASFIRKAKPDLLVLMHSAVAPIALLVKNTPCCLYWNEHPTNLAHLPSIYSPVRLLLTKLLHHTVFAGAKRANLIMPIGEDHRDDLIQHGVPAHKIQMVYMGVSSKFNHHISMNREDGCLKLIYVGTISQSRGRDVMIEAIKIIAEQHVNVHLTMIGAVPEELTYCLEKVRELSIEHLVTVLGRVTGDEVPAYLSQADAAICLWEPNIWNQFNPPTKLFEYLVAGLPVLVSNIRTHTRYVQDWHNGLIFNYDAKALALSIQALYIQKSQLPRLKIQAAESGQQYLWSKLEPIFLTEVRKVLAQ